MYRLGDKIITKKKHPCGESSWIVIRNGADYKLKCEKCGRCILLTPDELKKRMKSVIMNSGD